MESLGQLQEWVADEEMKMMSVRDSVTIFGCKRERNWKVAVMEFEVDTFDHARF